MLLKNKSVFSIGNIEFKVVHTPGHTPEHISFLVTDRGSGATEPMGIATGDFLFVGDLGRPDLLESATGNAGAANQSARVLYNSVKLLDGLPEFLQVWPAHGAGSACGKALGAVPTSTIGYEKRFNPAIGAATSEHAFVDYILTGQQEPPLYFARMKHENKDGPKLLGGLPEPRLASVVELKKIDTKSAVLIDTRPWAEYRKGHISGSFFHPFNKSFATDIGSLVGDNPDIYLICQPAQIENIVRNLVRIGLDSILGWAPPEIVSAYTKEGGLLVETKEESASKIKDRIDAGSVNILDVRRAAEYAEVHLQNVLNIPHTRLAARLPEVPNSKPLVVHCAGGVRSAYSCALLERAGYDVINLEGGMSAWQKHFG